MLLQSNNVPSSNVSIRLVLKEPLQQKWIIDENLHAWNQPILQMSLDSKLIPQWNHQKFNGEQRSIDLEVIRVMRECGARVGLNRRGSDHQDALMLVIIGTPGGVCCYYFQHLIVTNLSFIPWNKAKTKLRHDTTIWIHYWEIIFALQWLPILGPKGSKTYSLQDFRIRVARTVTYGKYLISELMTSSIFPFQTSTDSNCKTAAGLKSKSVKLQSNVWGQCLG